MYCLRCGAKLSEDARFCSNCGSTMLSARSPVGSQTAAPVRSSGDHSIPLKHGGTDASALPEASRTHADRSIPVRRNEPEKRTADAQQRAIVLPPAGERVSSEPHPFAPIPLASVQHEAGAPAEITAAAIKEDTGTVISEEKTEYTPVTFFSEETGPAVSAQPEDKVIAETEPVVTAESVSTDPGQEPESLLPEVSSDSPSKISDTAKTAEENSDVPAEAQEETLPAESSDEVPSVSGEDRKEKAARTRKQYIAAAAAVIVLLAGIFYAFRIWPQKQFEKFYAAGNEALEQLDYETAARNLALAYKIKQDDPSLNEKLYTAYEGLFDRRVSEGDTEGAITVGCAMVGLTPENDEKIKESLGGLYLTYVRTLLLDGRTEKASGTVTSAADYVSEEGLTALQELLDSFSQLSTFAETVAGMSDSGEHKDICSMIDEIKPLIIICSDTSSGRQPVVRVKEHSHEYVVFYRHSSGQYYVFYGDLTDEGRRKGNGTIYYDGRSTSKDMLYYYTSGWENDRPNGQFSEHEFTGSHYDTETVYEGSLKDGFFDGKISITWGSAGVYYGEYTGGKVIVQDIDEETGRYIIAYNEAHDDFLSFPNDPSSSRFGVDFY